MWFPVLYPPEDEHLLTAPEAAYLGPFFRSKAKAEKALRQEWRKAQSQGLPVAPFMVELRGGKAVSVHKLSDAPESGRQANPSPESVMQLTNAHRSYLARLQADGGIHCPRDIRRGERELVYELVEADYLDAFDVDDTLAIQLSSAGKSALSRAGNPGAPTSLVGQTASKLHKLLPAKYGVKPGSRPDKDRAKQIRAAYRAGKYEGDDARWKAIVELLEVTPMKAKLPERKAPAPAPKKAIWGLNRRSGLWEHVRSVTSDTEEAWMQVWLKDEGAREKYSHLVISSKKPTKKSPRGAVELLRASKPEPKKTSVMQEAERLVKQGDWSRADTEILNSVANGADTELTKMWIAQHSDPRLAKLRQLTFRQHQAAKEEPKPKPKKGKTPKVELEPKAADYAMNCLKGVPKGVSQFEALKAITAKTKLTRKEAQKAVREAKPLPPKPPLTEEEKRAKAEQKLDKEFTRVAPYMLNLADETDKELRDRVKRQMELRSTLPEDQFKAYLDNREKRADELRDVYLKKGYEDAKKTAQVAIGEAKKDKAKAETKAAKAVPARKQAESEFALQYLEELKKVCPELEGKPGAPPLKAKPPEPKAKPAPKPKVDVWVAPGVDPGAIFEGLTFVQQDVLRLLARRRGQWVKVAKPTGKVLIKHGLAKREKDKLQLTDFGLKVVTSPTALAEAKTRYDEPKKPKAKAKPKVAPKAKPKAAPKAKPKAVKPIALTPKKVPARELKLGDWWSYRKKGPYYQIKELRRGTSAMVFISEGMGRTRPAFRTELWVKRPAEVPKAKPKAAPKAKPKPAPAKAAQTDEEKIAARIMAALEQAGL